MFLQIILGAVFVGIGSQAFAQTNNCDPKSFLTHNVIAFDQNTETNLSLFDELSQSASSGQSSSLSGSYGAYSLSGNDARSASSSLKKLLDINYSESQKTALFVSALPREAVDAYVNCLKSRDNLSFTLSQGAIHTKEVLVTLNWHPQYSPPQFSTVGALATNGNVKDIIYNGQNFTQLSQVQMTDHSSLTVKIARDSIFEPTEIQGTIDGKPFDINIPNSPKFRLITELVEGTHVDYGPARETCTPGTPFTSCVSLASSDEGFLIPGSFRWKAPETLVLSERPLGNDTTSGDSLRICTSFSIGCPSIHNFADIHRVGTAMRIRAVPVTQ
jgi:hypothetical protein